jgi:hypothetical protein
MPNDHDIRAEDFAHDFTELARKAGITERCKLNFSERMRRRNHQDPRAFAEVDPEKLEFHFAPQVLDLPREHQRGLIAHEIGHVLCRDLPGGGTESDADDAAWEVLGVRVEYDCRWPGKGLQRTENPSSRVTFGKTGARENPESDEFYAERAARPVREVLTTTAEQLTRALYGVGVDELNRGTYPGTDIKKRQVPPDAVVRVIDRGFIKVEDDDGGWIAERVTDDQNASIGRRQFQEVKAALERVLGSRANPSLPEGWGGFDDEPPPPSKPSCAALLSALRVGDVVKVGRSLWQVERNIGVTNYAIKHGTKGRKLYRFEAVSLDPCVIEVREVYPGSGDIMQDKPAAARGASAGDPLDWTARVNPPYSGWRKGWWTKALPKDTHKISYPTKTAALNVFLDYNRGVVDDYGGESMKHAPASFDAINHRFGIKGKRQVDNIAKAVWWAMPAGSPYYLEDIDVNLLNETAPAIYNQRGLQFEIPDYAQESALLEQEAEYWLQKYGDVEYPDEPSEVPF